MANFLVLIHNTYYVRLDVPKDLRTHFGKRVLKKTLQTSNKSEAKAKGMVLISKWKAKFYSLRSKNNGNETSWTRYVLNLSNHYKEELQAALARIKELNLDPKKDDDLFEDIQHDPIMNIYGLDKDDYFSSYLEDNLKEKYKLNPTQMDQARLAFNRGKFEAIFIPASISEFETEYRQQVKEKTADLAIAALQSVAHYFKEKDIDRITVAGYINHLISTENKKRQTISRYINIAAKYYDWLKSNKYLTDTDHNPFKKQEIKTTNTIRSGSYKPFNAKEVASIYREAAKKDDYTLAKAIQIAAYTGLRIEEAFRVETGHISYNQIEVLDSKTHAGIRTIPIHPLLKEIIDPLITDSIDGYLLPSTSKNKYQKRSSAAGKRFGRIKKALGYSEAYVFHSIRKCFVTQLEQAGIPESVTADIVGHEKQTISYGLYSGGSSFEQKFNAVKKIHYDW